ncbi:MerR family transcriptional regulator [Paenibacillus sp. YIM B09110]|uniref:MerR family transcriptional regulator n=1 Tax=Paenibacillus sp. YIM B09110 TaxID=3126102 RepID=UPI00301D7DDE
MWIIRKKEVALYEEKKKLERLNQDIRIYANENKSAYAEEPFNINEVSELTQVPKSTIRYWEQAGYVTADRDPDNRYRRYSGSHLLKIRLIQVLQSSQMCGISYLHQLIQFTKAIF